MAVADGIGANHRFIGGYLIPRVLTAKHRGQEASRHVSAGWEDFDLFVERQVRDMTKQLDHAQEELISREMFYSGEALAKRSSIYQLHLDALGDEWRRISREAADSRADLGRVARHWFHIEPAFRTPAGEERILQEGREKLEAALNEAWPDPGR